MARTVNSQEVSMVRIFLYAKVVAKIAAAEENITITEWISKAIIREVNRQADGN